MALPLPLYLQLSHSPEIDKQIFLEISKQKSGVCFFTQQCRAEKIRAPTLFFMVINIFYSFIMSLWP